MVRKSKKWFWGAVVYQIYPRSFYDSNNDGVGDIKGIAKKLDYLAETLGVSAIWLCPFYKSPMADFGYDISDYQTVDPTFGTLDDFKELVKQAHNKNLRVIIDLVANHTSDEHPWFLESKSSKDNPKRNWYIWRNSAQAGQAPNDWLSVFGGSAWEYDSTTDQHYLHTFSVKQPDLNWENPEVRQAIKKVMEFWLELGVDGFRADAVYWLSKDHRLRDDPLSPLRGSSSSHDYKSLLHTHSRKGPNLYGYLREITAVLRRYPDTFIILEASIMAAKPGDNSDITEYMKLYKYIDPEYSAPFNFELLHIPWKAQLVKLFVDNFQSKLRETYLPVYTLGNHDNPRLASRIGGSAVRTAAMMLLTLPGMPFIYYGEEIGMENVAIDKSLQMDPFRSQGEDRDKVRTPLRWDDTKNTGFSSVTPWLPVGLANKNINIKSQLSESDSLLSLYRKLIMLRSQSNVLKYGNYLAWEIRSDKVYGFIRQLESDRYAILLNFGSHTEAVDLGGHKGAVKLSTYLDKTNLPVVSTTVLRPHEGQIIELG